MSNHNSTEVKLKTIADIESESIKFYIKDKAYYDEKELDDAMETYGDDIDCYFVLTAYAEICRFFNVMFENAQIRNHVNDMKKVFDTFMKIIWYELIGCDEATEIAMFTKINM